MFSKENTQRLHQALGRAISAQDHVSMLKGEVAGYQKQLTEAEAEMTRRQAEVDELIEEFSLAEPASTDDAGAATDKEGE
jgi:hypothetical protein